MPRISVSQIDLLRVLAMAGIFVHHLWRAGEGADAIERCVAWLAYAGQYGVIVFNIITGFVLALPYLGPEGRAAPGYYPFLRRRFFRIVPTYHCALVLFTVLNILVFRPPEYTSTLLRFLQNLVFLQGFDPATIMSNMAAYWYLTLLASFYLVFPLLLRFYLCLKPTMACGAICLICWGGLCLLRVVDSSWESHWALLYFNLPARLPEFAIGMWLAASWKPEQSAVSRIPLSPSFTVFALVLTGFALVASPWARQMAPPVSLIYHVACTTAVFLLLFLAPPAARMGKTSVVKKISVASYGIYLSHQPLFSYVEFWLQGWQMSPMTQFVLVILTVGPITYLLANLLESLTAIINETVSDFFYPPAKSRN